MRAIATSVEAAYISQGPALLLGLAGLVGILMSFVGWRMARWARRSTGSHSLVVMAGVVAIAAFFLILTGLGFRHYGGHTGMTGAYRCDAWWAQIGSAHGVADGGGPSWPWCKRVAESAVAPGLAGAGVGAVFIAGLVAVAVQLLRRRPNDKLQDLKPTSPAPNGA